VQPAQSLGQLKPVSPHSGSQKKLPHTHSEPQSSKQSSGSPQRTSQNESPQMHSLPQSSKQVSGLSPHDGSQKKSPQTHSPPQSSGQLKGSSQAGSHSPSPQAHWPVQVREDGSQVPSMHATQSSPAEPHAAGWLPGRHTPSSQQPEQSSAQEGGAPPSPPNPPSALESSMFDRPQPIAITITSQNDHPSQRSPNMRPTPCREASRRK
jgi:hypothetical protein